LAPVEVGLALAAAATGVAVPVVGLEWLADRDWLAENRAQFPPLRLGRFYIHGSQGEAPVPPGRIEIKIDAATAFGSGRHASTAGCLLALEALSHRPIRSVLDIGTGSGILAIAAAKLWRAPVLATDIDPCAVRICAENARLNGVSGLISAVCADAYDTPIIRRRAPFDLIVSNILARPLKRLAGRLRRHLAPCGIAVLAGFVDGNANAVLAVHAAHRLPLVRRWRIEDWTTLVLVASPEPEA
jgi:ribosomal protein L11 methyltransferase